jgi:hypothetical protein
MSKIKVLLEPDGALDLNDRALRLLFVQVREAGIDENLSVTRSVREAAGMRIRELANTLHFASDGKKTFLDCVRHVIRVQPLLAKLYVAQLENDRHADIGDDQ